MKATVSSSLIACLWEWMQHSEHRVRSRASTGQAVGAERYLQSQSEKWSTKLVLHLDRHFRWKTLDLDRVRIDGFQDQNKEESSEKANGLERDDDPRTSTRPVIIFRG